MRILVTGSSRGIGKCVFDQLKDEGHQVLGIARSPSDESMHALDVNATDDILELVRTEWGEEKLNVVIHNAAMGYYGEFSQQKPEQIVQMVNTNLLAPLKLTHQLYPFLEAAVRAQEPAQVIFISSAHDVASTPLFATYTATKAALSGLARSLEREWAREGIQVLSVAMGPTNTSMHESIGLHLSDSTKKFFMKDSVAAKKIVRCVRKNKRGRVKVGALSWWVQFQASVRHFGRVLGSACACSCRKRKSLKNQRVLVTGAAGGIGQAFVDILKQEDALVVATDRVAVKEEDHVLFIPMDLTSPEQIQACAREKISRDAKLTGIVMNAGLNVVGRFVDIPLTKHEIIVHVNFLGPLLLTHALMTNDLLEASGWMVFLSSLSYFVGYPGASSYAAAKDGIASFADCLHATAVFPGPTRTAMAAACSPGDNDRAASRMDPQAVASLALQNGQKKRAIAIPGGQNKLFALLGVLCPKVMSCIMEKIIFDKVPQGSPLEIQIKEEETTVEEDRVSIE